MRISTPAVHTALLCLGPKGDNAQAAARAPARQSPTSIRFSAAGGSTPIHARVSASSTQTYAIAAGGKVQPFDKELQSEADAYLATLSTNTLGVEWMLSNRPGLNEHKQWSDLIAVKNRSSENVYVAVWTGRDSLFPAQVSASGKDGTTVNAAMTSKGPEVGVKHESTDGTQLSSEPHPGDKPRIITGKRVPKGREHFIGPGMIGSVYLHIYLDYKDGLWCRKLDDEPIIPLGHFYTITDEELGSYEVLPEDKRFDHKSVQQSKQATT